jgi:hypothetical protein
MPAIGRQRVVHLQRLEIAAHGGQRRLQLVRHVGEQLPSRVNRGLQRGLARGQLGAHVVERPRHHRHLVVPVVDGARAEIAVGDAEGGGLEIGQPPPGRSDQNHRRNRREAEEEQEVLRRQHPHELVDDAADRRRRGDHEPLQHAACVNRRVGRRAAAQRLSWPRPIAAQHQHGRLPGAFGHRPARGRECRAVGEHDVERAAGIGL